MQIKAATIVSAVRFGFTKLTNLYLTTRSMQLQCFVCCGNTHLVVLGVVTSWLLVLLKSCACSGVGIGCRVVQLITAGMHQSTSTALHPLVLHQQPLHAPSCCSQVSNMENSNSARSWRRSKTKCLSIYHSCHQFPA